MTVPAENIYTYCDYWDCLIAAKEREISFPHTSLPEEILVNTQHFLGDVAGLAKDTAVNTSKAVLRKLPHF